MVKIGVFICHCGTNISKVVNISKVLKEISAYPLVAFAQDYKYMCSEQGQSIIKNAIREHNLDRIVIASCTPKLHEKTFRNCLFEADLNPYLLEIANIREQCSWVHYDNPALATEKAIDIIKIAIGKISFAQSLTCSKVSIERRTLVIGGGIAGIQSAIDVAQAGYPVVLVETTPSIGGRMAQLDKTFPTLDCSACILTPKMVEVSHHPLIKILTHSNVEEVKGYVGNFEVSIRMRARSVDMKKCTGCGVCQSKCPVNIDHEFDEKLSKRAAIYIPFPQAVPNVPIIDRQNCRFFTSNKCGLCKKICPSDAVDFTQEDSIINEKFGSIIIATGFDLFDHSVYGEYGYGKIKNVINSIQFERLVNSSGPTEGHVLRPSDGKEAKTVVFIQCVGSRDDKVGKPYCSKICCMYTAKQALLLKEHVPDAFVYVFYIDIRAAGKNYEEFVKRVQDTYHVKYIRGRVSKILEDGDKLVVRGFDTLSELQMEINADMVVLASGVIPRHDTVQVARMLNVALDANGFYKELHPKLAPVEKSTPGIFISGSCQFAKDIPDTVLMAGAAAVKSLSLFAKEYLTSEPMIAQVNTSICTGCLNCKTICPYKAILIEEIKDLDGKIRIVAKVNETICRGCGTCVATCPSQCINIKGFTNEQMFASIEAL
ncbi:MAG: CoB--CoM heterodisulfide reductase iron-sulfur subunit A family protein [Candidatus Firestonebacteria bacterium]|nr:CoB--CoM heterodisulfide reductase iron-sulfur subunit A family protein [Candidatus Firestonebacteria bacterium]